MLDRASEPVRLRSRKHLALLLYLASHPGRQHPREKVAALLWDSEPRLARHSLSQALYDIRSHLPAVGLEASVNTVGLDGERLAVDAREFEAAVRSNDLARAVELYRGDFAPDVERVGTSPFQRWVEEERHRLQRLAELVHYRHLRACDSRGSWGEMCLTAMRLLEMNPLNEEAHRALIRGLWLQGDQSAALSHFEEYEEFLRRELPEGLSRETLELVETVRSSQPGAAPSGVPVRREVRLVGREEEFAVLKGALAQLDDGRGGALVVRGEAGIGKTRLLREVTELATLEGICVLRSRCFAAEEEVAFGPVVEGLRSLLDEVARDTAEGKRNGARGGGSYLQLGHLFPETFGTPEAETGPYARPAAGRRRLFEEVADLMRRATRERPVLWAVEDLHWADASSASLLHYLVRRLEEHPFLLFTTVRAHEELSAPALELLEGVPRSAIRAELRLAPLARDAIEELVSEATGLSGEEMDFERLYRLSGGNPFYALEVARSQGRLRSVASDEWSSSPEKLITGQLDSVLRRRLQGLRPEAVRILEVVAVAGRHATPSLVGKAAGLEHATVAEAARPIYERGLLRDARGRLEFHHDITREYVYGNMGQLQRAALHLAVGEVLAGDGHDVGIGTLARHFEKGGDAPRAFEYAIRAAEESEQSYGHEEAATLAAIALEQAGNDPQRRARALRVLSQAELASGQLASAQSHLEDLAGLGVGTSEETARIEIEVARARVELAEWQPAIRQLDRVAADLGRIGEDARLELQMLILELRLKTALRRRDQESASTVIGEIEELMEAMDGEGSSSNAQVVGLLSQAGYATFAHSSELAVRYLDEILAEADTLPRDLAMEARLLRGGAALRLARWDEAERHLREALETADRCNDVLTRANALNGLECCALESGRWEDFLLLHEEITKASQSIPARLHFRLSPAANLGDCLWYSGKTNEAKAQYQDTLHLAETLDAESSRVALKACLGLIALEQGDRAVASEHWGALEPLDAQSIRGVQDRFKVAWLGAAMDWAHNHAVLNGELTAAAEAESQADLVSSLKLHWLGALFRKYAEREAVPRNPSEIDPELVTEMRSKGLGWFAYFSRRWMQRAFARLAT